MLYGMQGLDPGAVFRAVWRAEEVFKGSGVGRRVSRKYGIGVCGETYGKRTSRYRRC